MRPGASFGEPSEQVFQIPRCRQKVMVTFRAFRVLAPKLLVNEFLHGGNVSVVMTHPAANKSTTTLDWDRCFGFAKEAFDGWHRLAVFMLAVTDVVYHDDSFFVCGLGDLQMRPHREHPDAE